MKGEDIMTDFERALPRYNNLMTSLCWEHCTIGTDYSEHTDGWNIRDMIAECDYILSTYYECGHLNEDLRHGDLDERKMWRNETSRLKRFIDKYEPLSRGIKCNQRHCSRFDKE